jgi:GMP reductase
MRAVCKITGELINGGFVQVARFKKSRRFLKPRASEGKIVRVPYKGLVSVTLQDILGGLRSACTYVGASQLKQLSRRTTFIRVTQQVNQMFSSDASA